MEALGAKSPGSLGLLLGGCMGMVVPLGDCTMGGPWWKEVLGRCMEPEAWWADWEGPNEMMEGWSRCWLGAWGWLEDLALVCGALD